MRILVVNDFLICGGAEKISLEIKRLLKNIGYDVYFMSFDNEYDAKIKKLDTDISKHINIKCGNQKINKMIFNPFIYYKIKRKLQELKPDIIILNNIFCSPITQLKALKGYKVIQIVHDYSIVCPKSVCIDSNYNVCNGYRYHNCIKECSYHNSKLNIILKKYQLKRLEKLRKKIIVKFISPSEKLNTYLKDYGYNSMIINNPIKVTDEILNKKDRNIIKYIYVGTINEPKGIIRFLEVFDKFSKKYSAKINVIGKFEDEKQSKEIKEKYKENKNIKFLGYLDNSETIAKIRESNYIVVPSIWMENYPTTALEGMSNKTCVIGSDRGGIPELLKDDRGFLFDILDNENMKKVLIETVNLDVKKYNDIVESAYNYVKKNNSEITYTKKLDKLIKELEG